MSVMRVADSESRGARKAIGFNKKEVLASLKTSVSAHPHAGFALAGFQRTTLRS